jgi:hypothetical protein
MEASISLQNKKSTYGNRHLPKLFYKNYNTRKEKMKVNIYAFGRKIEQDEEIIVPNGHHFYNVLDGILNNLLDREGIA